MLIQLKGMGECFNVPERSVMSAAEMESSEAILTIHQQSPR